MKTESKGAGRPKVTDKVVDVRLCLKKSIAYRWPNERIKSMIEEIEGGVPAPKVQTVTPNHQPLFFIFHL